ncbi:hypothetical protein EYC84_010384 [Monilinia fructicola]|uniref:Uncharacterized protein n=1 Tax=Monilinia fructicola TaxID=38448 RepID=A0A5M9JI00_MONFR|nr:hypothetical protein EYC84_010384 [Monilinia fructicola]
MTPPLPDPDEITRGIIMTLLLLDTAETTIDIRNAAFVAPQSATTMRPTVVALSEQFWAKNPTFPKDLTYLGHVLTLTLIILNRIKFFEEDKLVVFLGTVYLPYLAKEQKNNPLSLDALWHLKGYQDRMIFDEGSLCCLMLNSHGADQAKSNVKKRRLGDQKQIVIHLFRHIDTKSFAVLSAILLKTPVVPSSSQIHYKFIISPTIERVRSYAIM